MSNSSEKLLGTIIAIAKSIILLITVPGPRDNCESDLDTLIRSFFETYAVSSTKSRDDVNLDGEVVATLSLPLRSRLGV